jgi:hypothetical protein
VFCYGNDHSSNDDDREKRHLKARVQESVRIPSQHAKRSEAYGIQAVSLPEKEPGKQKQRYHPEGTADGVTEPGENCVG